MTNYHGPRTVFPHPFLDLMHAGLPSSLQEGLLLCQSAMEHNGPFRAAIERLVSYFITDIKITTDDSSQTQAIKDVLYDELDVSSYLARGGLAWMTYGTHFVSFERPLTRVVRCRSCSSDKFGKRLFDVPLYEFFTNEAYQASWVAGQRTCRGRCFKCNAHTEWKILDELDVAKTEIAIKDDWSPMEMWLDQPIWTGAPDVYWRIPGELRRRIRDGSVVDLERTPWEVITTAIGTQHFHFARGRITVTAAKSLPGRRMGGWGWPPILHVLPQAWYTQLVQRYYVAAAADRTLPIRVMSPRLSGVDPAAASVGPLAGINPDRIKHYAYSIIQEHRNNPTNIAYSPVGFEMGSLGADTNAMAGHEVLRQGYETFYDSINTPMELFRGTLRTEASILSARLMVATHHDLVRTLNRLLQLLTDAVCEVYRFGKAKAVLETPKYADDAARLQYVMQMAMMGKTSDTTLLAQLGTTPQAETQLQMQEAEDRMEAEMEANARMEQRQAAAGLIPPAGAAGIMSQQQEAAATQQQGGAAPAPAAPMAGIAPASQMSSPVELKARAQQEAQQVAVMSEGQRRSYMAQLRNQDDVYASILAQELKRYTDQVALQTRDQALGRA